MPDTRYRILRQQVVAQLPPSANRETVLQVIAHAAICGGTQGAPRDGTLIDDVLGVGRGAFRRGARGWAWTACPVRGISVDQRLQHPHQPGQLLHADLRD
jgi:hypothetical protein